jgi:hypothetical protein
MPAEAAAVSQSRGDPSGATHPANPAYGVTVHPLSCRLADLRLTLDAPARRLDPAARQRLDDLWAREAARNPRLFDGPILSAVEIDAAAGHLRCRRATYRELLAHPVVDTGVMQVSVTGVATTPDARGRESVLLARRSPQTRIYGSMWELAPSGGLDPPPRATSDADDLMSGQAAWDQLMAEVEEELGLDPAALAPGDPLCLCADPVARSIDIVLPVRLPAPAAPAHAWEYLEARWIPRDDLPGFVSGHAADIIAPTRALLGWLGWA